MNISIDTSQFSSFIFSVKDLSEKTSQGMGVFDILDYYLTIFRLRIKFRKIRRKLEDMSNYIKANPQVLNSIRNLQFYSMLNENIAEMIDIVSEDEKLAKTSLLTELNRLKKVSYSSEAYIRRHSKK